MRCKLWLSPSGRFKKKNTKNQLFCLGLEFQPGIMKLMRIKSEKLPVPTPFELMVDCAPENQGDLCL